MDKLRLLNQAKTSLLAFEAAARNLSFIRAAQELNVTQPAISRSINRLEKLLNTRLFIRHARGLSLSNDGVILYESVSVNLKNMELALRNITSSRTAERTVTFSVSTAWVNLWFMPRLESMQQHFPGVDFRFQMVGGEPHGALDGVDIGIRLERLTHIDNKLVALAPEIIVPVCSKEYFSKHNLKSLSGAFEGIVFLDYTSPRVSWEDVLGSLLLDQMKPIKKIQFSDYSVILQAAIAGKGLALGWTHLIAKILKDGELTIFGDKIIRTGEQYVLCSNRGINRKIVLDIHEWILHEMKNDISDLKEAYPLFNAI